MTEKLYGLDDIPENWALEALEFLKLEKKYACTILRLLNADIKGEAISFAETPQLALHKAIQKARGEI
jgi:hypothetical protein